MRGICPAFFLLDLNLVNLIKSVLNQVGTWFGAVAGLYYPVHGIAIRLCVFVRDFPCFCIVKRNHPEWFGVPTVIQQGLPESRWDH